MRTTKEFGDSKVRKMAREICGQDFQLTFPVAFLKDVDLMNQIRDSSSPVRDPIAEGFERGISPVIIQFMSIAKASRTDCHSSHYRAPDRNHITDKHFEYLHQKPIDPGRRISNLRIPEKQGKIGQ
jgi:four helix bundle protein